FSWQRLARALRREHIAGDAIDRYVGQPAHVHAADASRGEVIGIDGVTAPQVGILADPAWAQDTAGADLEQRAFKLVDDLGRFPLFLNGGHSCLSFGLARREALPCANRLPYRP